MFCLAYFFEGYQCDWIIFCQVLDPSLASRQVLPDAPCSNEIFIDLAFEGIQRAFGEAADVALNVKRFGWESDVHIVFFCWFPSFLGSWVVLFSVIFFPEVETHGTHGGISHHSFLPLNLRIPALFFFWSFSTVEIFKFFLLFLKRCIVPLLLFTMHEVSQIESVILY